MKEPAKKCINCHNDKGVDLYVWKVSGKTIFYRLYCKDCGWEWCDTVKED